MQALQRTPPAPWNPPLTWPDLVNYPAVHWDQLELPFAATATCSPHAVFEECPLCAGSLTTEHAHYRCGVCGWRDSCCD